MESIDLDTAIFVFGSNRSGIHGAGAAYTARLNYGAVMGVGEGLTGRSYALPTVGYRITLIELDAVQTHVLNFIEFARSRPDLTFQVTKVGCGLGGFRNHEIAPMFDMAPENCWFDSAWKNFLPEGTKFWGTF
jgi:hypothetical protein